MRFAVLGAGAIGGYVAAHLALAGNEVEIFARGAHLRAIQHQGLSLTEDGVTRTVRLRATDDARSLHAADVVVLGFKAHQLHAARDAIAAALHPGAGVLAIQNGIPWWYGDGHHVLRGRRLRSVDGDGELGALIPVGSVIGGIAYWSASIDPPGTVVHANPGRLIIGAPAGSDPRIEPLAAVLLAAGLDVAVTEAIRPAIWMKLFGNVGVNPISAIGRATVAEIFGDPRARALVMTVAREALAVATALGDAPPEVDLERRFAMSPRIGSVRTSMLQDLDAGRPLELGAIVGAVSELGAIAGIPTPALDAVLALAELADRVNRSTRTAPPYGSPSQASR